MGRYKENFTFSGFRKGCAVEKELVWNLAQVNLPQNIMELEVLTVSLIFFCFFEGHAL